MSMVFALSPAMAIEGIINFKKNMGQSIFRYSIEKLDEELYNCHPNGMNHFLQTLAVLTREYGWDHNNDGVFISQKTQVTQCQKLKTSSRTTEWYQSRRSGDSNYLLSIEKFN